MEFDVLALGDGALVVAHSYDLREVSHGMLEGSVRDWTLRALRADCPEVPTLDEALAFFVDEAPEIGPHLDLKLRGRERDVVTALRRHGLVERALVSSFDPRTTKTLSLLDGGLRVGITVPRSVLGITENGRVPWLARGGLASLRRAIPPAARSILAFARASALVLHHSVVTSAVVRRAHASGAAVVTWTVDDAAELRRVDEAGVDAIVTNDPRIFTSTLETT